MNAVEPVKSCETRETLRNSRNAAKLAKRRETRETPRNSRSAAKLQNRVECVESIECAESCRSVLNRVEADTLPPPRTSGVLHDFFHSFLHAPSWFLVAPCG